MAAILTKNSKRIHATQADAPPLPTELAKLKLELLRKRQEWGQAKRAGEGLPKKAGAFFALFMARLNTNRAMRSFQHYSRQHGPLLSAGIGFNMFFSVTGLLTTGFAVAGIVLGGSPALQDAVIDSVAAAAPGLLQVDGGEGLVDPQSLLNPSGLGWTALIAAVVTVFISLGWIASIREGIRGILNADPLVRNAVLQKLIDAGTLLLLGVILVISAGASLIFGTAADWFIGLLKLDEAVAAPIAATVKIVVPLLLNCATAAVLFRIAAGLKLGRRAFLEAVVLAGVGTTVLQLFSTELLARSGNNPVLASFAIIIGLLIWFNLVSQVYLVSASWSAIREADTESGETPRKKVLGSRRVAPRT
ncbi:membrane protein [Paenarthrobacter nitroguajacolicus]|uniref:YihY/virulence factor BrkB family protein n=1 Tax=Paenarthrobacter nitroguajacolicus TaxID=211146 RepID=UPI002865B036|nr:YihY/virulence factor BrkB family protein [Paenarthrobacter nitroguajacolicus]MDR6985928.1 membrane protein [Paenarthrobacter nitroguajacolicus]